MLFTSKQNDLGKRLVRRLINLIIKLIPVSKWRHEARRFVKQDLDFISVILKQNRVKKKVFHAAARSSSFSALVIGNDLTVTGAPVVLLMEVKALLKNGASVLVASMRGGGLTAELERLKVPNLISSVFNTYEPSMKKLIQGFDLVIVNSLPCGDWVEVVPEDTPLIWYVHEGADIPYYLKNQPQFKQALLKCRHLYVVSEHAASYLPDGARSQVLRLGVPDFFTGLQPAPVGDRVRFALVGTYVKNKGQHLVLEALGGLDKNRLSELEFHFIGGNQTEEYYQGLLDQCDPDWPVKFSGEIEKQIDKWDVYNRFDVFCVPSFDETCSLVLLEACMLGKPFIISDKVGGGYMLDEGRNGLSFAAGDPVGLRNCLLWFLDNKSKVREMGRRARLAYEEKGSWEQFEENFISAVRSVRSKP